MNPEAIVAHTMGSFWLCLDCVKRDPCRTEPARLSDLLEGVSYYCDVCGGAIRRLQ